jgi:hypothetical protein
MVLWPTTFTIYNVHNYDIGDDIFDVEETLQLDLALAHSVPDLRVVMLAGDFNFAAVDASSGHISRLSCPEKDYHAIHISFGEARWIGGSSPFWRYNNTNRHRHTTGRHRALAQLLIMLHLFAGTVCSPPATVVCHSLGPCGRMEVGYGRPCSHAILG